MAARETLPISTLLGSAAALAAAAGLVALLVPTFFRIEEAQLRAERGWTSTPADTLMTKSAQRDRIAHYAWIDRQKGVVALPIERAMELARGQLAAEQESRR
ncbi:MAG: hypothetical protein IPJ19_18335 [Planctomycetes bacterium]|nr:hypothetical protein [Planctomycetota bacterium]